MEWAPTRQQLSSCPVPCPPSRVACERFRLLLIVSAKSTGAQYVTVKNEADGSKVRVAL